MVERKRVNWLAVRTYYLAGHSAAECATKYGVSRRQIDRKRTEESWDNQRSRNVQDVQRNVQEQHRSDTAKTILSHIEYADRLMAIAMQGEEDLAAIDPGRSRIEARKAMLEAADKAVRIAREVRGFKSGEASEANTENDAPSVPVEDIRKNVIQRSADYQIKSA